MRKTLSKINLTKVIIVGNLTFFLPNLILLMRGFDSRYWADDYCFSGILKQYGFIKGLEFFYTTVSNRFSSFIFVATLEAFGSRSIQWVSTVSILLIFSATFLLLRSFLHNDHIRLHDGFLLFLSQVIIFFSLYISPNIEQSVYWRSGLSHYFIPLFFLISISQLVLFSGMRMGKSHISVIVFLIAFFAAGLSESYAALQTGALLVAIIVLPIFQTNGCKDKVSSLVAALAGSLGGMAVMVVSPGNKCV